MNKITTALVGALVALNLVGTWFMWNMRTQVTTHEVVLQQIVGLINPLTCLWVARGFIGLTSTGGLL